MTATKVVVTDQGVYHKHHLVSVELMATVKPVSGSGVPNGTVTFDMVMPPGMKKMRGMKPGTTNFGTVPLSNGEAMLTLKAKKVLKMPLSIIYNGDTHFMSSTATPAELMKSGLKGMSMGMRTGMKM